MVMHFSFKYWLWRTKILYGKLVPGPKFPEKNGPPGPKFHGKLVHCRTKIFRGGPIFPENFGPGDQNSMAFWSPGPKCSRTNFPVTEQSPKRSTRKRSQTLSISRSTMMRVMTEDLGMFPYRIQTHQKLSEADKDRRKEMAKVLVHKIEESDTFLTNLWTTDEAHFHLDGQVNSKNNVYWGTSPPVEVAERPLHSFLRSQHGLRYLQEGLLAILFREESSGCNRELSSERYVEVLDKFWTELQKRFNSTLNRQWFQQDGATPILPMSALNG